MFVNKINKIFNLKLVKIGATLGLIYILFLSSKNDPRSISNSINKDNISLGIKTVSKAVQDYKYYTNVEQNNQQGYNQQSAETKIKDYATTTQLPLQKVECKDKVSIELIVYNNSHQEIKKQNIDLIIGEKKDIFLEKLVNNLATNYFRLVELPLNEGTTEYKITILNLYKNFSPEIICNK
jgi:hypothetical protein